MKKRNIVLISIDEVRPDHLSCYGYERLPTPNIDRVAKGGVLFETCISAACITPLSMASVLCGAYPNKHTVRDPFSRIQPKTIAETLKEYGYKSCLGSVLVLNRDATVRERHGATITADKDYLVKKFGSGSKKK